MNEKKQSGKKRLFLLVLVAFGIVLWITFTNLNELHCVIHWMKRLVL